MKDFLHDDVKLEWNSKVYSTWLWVMLSLSDELGKAYVRSKIRISHIIAEKIWYLRYSHFVKR
jgi:hypothetical protein